MDGFTASTKPTATAVKISQSAMAGPAARNDFRERNTTAVTAAAAGPRSTPAFTPWTSVIAPTHPVKPTATTAEAAHQQIAMTCSARRKSVSIDQLMRRYR